MAAIFAFLTSGTGRRLLAFLLGLALPILNKKLNLELDATAIVADVALVLGYIAQSAFKQAADTSADAKVESAALAGKVAGNAGVSVAVNQ